MGKYETSWECCGDSTKTDGWIPDVCPFCHLATVTAERDELASDIVRMKAHLEAAERAAKANGEEAKAANERAERSEARAKAMREALEWIEGLGGYHYMTNEVQRRAQIALKESSND